MKTSKYINTKKKTRDSLVATVFSAFTFLRQDKTATGKVADGEEDVRGKKAAAVGNDHEI